MVAKDLTIEETGQFNYTIHQREKSRCKRMRPYRVYRKHNINNHSRHGGPEWFQERGKQHRHCLNADGSPKIVYKSYLDALEFCRKMRLRVLWSSMTAYPCVGHVKHTQTAWHVGHTWDGYSLTTQYLDEAQV